ncbi:MAG: NYN domain-containing protein [Nanoarchaeota archaeon]
MKKGNPKRISIYIDGANFVYGIKTINSRYNDFMFDFEKFAKEICKTDKLVKVNYYNASLKRKLNINKWERQQKLFDRLRKLKKFEIILCKRQKRLNNLDEEFYSIKGDDIHLAIDMIMGATKDKYDKSILISGDGDFTSLVRAIKTLKKEIEIYSFKEICSDALIKKNKFKFIDKKLVNKCFYRGSK